VPLDIVGQYAQEDVASNTVFVAVVDGTHFEIYGLDAAKPSLAGARRDSLPLGSPQGVLCQGGTRRQRVFHQAEVFVALDEPGGGEVLVGDFGAHHVEAVNGGFAGDIFAARLARAVKEHMAGSGGLFAEDLSQEAAFLGDPNHLAARTLEVGQAGNQ